MVSVSDHDAVGRQDDFRTDGGTSVGVIGRMRSFWSIQFISWLGVIVPAFVGVVLVLEAIQAPVVVVFVAGAIFADIADRIVQWFTDWWIASQRITEGRDPV